MAVAGVVALAAHLLLLLAMRGAGHAANRATATAPPSRQYEVDMTALQPVPAVRRPERAEIEKRAPTPRARAIATLRAPAAAARAAAVVAQEPDPGAPVDLTADAVVTGHATAYAGGVTTSAGTSASPGRGGSSMAGAGDAVRATAIDRARPVSLESEKWSCPWPREADAEQIDEQTVVLRVVVDAGGAAEQATVLADPGHGFGAAAVACALRTRFVPARDGNGEAVRSVSPPIRVRFTR
jgi:periplasmic protein TonB